MKLYINGEFVGYGVIYQCNFCGEKFDTASQCAKHIEKKSFMSMVYPSDIKIIPKRKKAREARK